MIKAISTELEVFKADENGDARFKGVAYASSIVNLGWIGKVIVNLASFVMPSSLPMLLDHNPSKTVGHADKMEVKGGKLLIEGTLYASDEDGAKIIDKGNKGFPWKFSIGWNFGEERFIPKGQKVKVNGKSFAGPITVLGRNILKEVSFTPIPADTKTKAVIFSDDGLNSTHLTIDGEQTMSKENKDELEVTSTDQDAKLKEKDDQIAKLNDKVKALELTAREAKLGGLGVKLSDEEKKDLGDMPEAAFNLFLSKLTPKGTGDDDGKLAAAEKARMERAGLFGHKAAEGVDVDETKGKVSTLSLKEKAAQIAEAHTKKMATA